MSDDLKHLIGKKFRTVGDESGNKNYCANIIKTDLKNTKYPILVILTDDEGSARAACYTKDLKYTSVSFSHSLDLVEVTPCEDTKVDEPLAIKRKQFQEERDAARAANAISSQMLFNKLRLMKVKLSTIEITTATLRDQIDSILEQISE